MAHDLISALSPDPSATNVTNRVRSLSDLLTDRASSGVLEVWGEGGREAVEWSRLLEWSRARAQQLGALGLETGASIAIAGPSCLVTLSLIVGAWLAHVAVCVLPPPSQLVTWPMRLSVLRPSSLLVHESYWPDTIAQFPWADVFDEEKIATRFNRPQARKRSKEVPEGTAVVQFTSGTTGGARAVLVTEENLITNVSEIGERIKMSDHDTMVSWLPLYHDMGLFGTFALPLLSGASLRLTDTRCYRRDLRIWLRMMDRVDDAITVAPDSSYALATRALRGTESFDLRGVRLALNGSEPIDAHTFGDFCTAARLRSDAACPVYGLAEATLAVTIPKSGGLNLQGKPTSGEDLSQFEACLRRPYAPHVGAALAHHEVRIVDLESRRPVAAGVVGEVETRGPSVAQYHLDSRGAIVKALSRGWLQTGDLGTMRGGNLVISGRLKDVIKQGGRTVCAEDVEAVVASSCAVRRSRIAAFPSASTDGRSGVAIAIEGAHWNTSRIECAKVAVREQLGLRVSSCTFVKSHSLPRTSSGKISRIAVRHQLASQDLSLGAAAVQP